MAAKKKTHERKAPPPLMRDEVLREAGYKCGNPACRNILVLELHHIEWVRDGGGTTPSNLLALCPVCHGLHTAGHIPREAIVHWKGLLVALNGAFSRESMELLLFLGTIGKNHLWFSSDGVLKFAGLIASGFVEQNEAAFFPGERVTAYSGAMDPRLHRVLPSATFRLQLTEKGNLLVEAWKKGDMGIYYGTAKSQVPTEP